MLVRDVMTPRPITIRTESDYLAAVAIMRAGNFRRLPVVDREGNLVGIVTDDDLNTAQAAQAARQAFKQQAIRGDGVLIRVQEVMHTPVITIAPDYPLEEAARMMVEHRIGCLPVIEEGSLIGILTDTDVFRTFVQVLGGGSKTIRLCVQIDNTPGQFAALAGRIGAIGGNILSVASHPASTPDRINFTLRVESVTFDALLSAVEVHPRVEILHVWDQTK